MRIAWMYVLYYVGGGGGGQQTWTVDTFHAISAECIGIGLVGGTDQFSATHISPPHS